MIYSQDTLPQDPTEIKKLLASSQQQLDALFNKVESLQDIINDKEDQILEIISQRKQLKSILQSAS